MVVKEEVSGGGFGYRHGGGCVWLFLGSVSRAGLTLKACLLPSLETLKELAACLHDSASLQAQRLSNEHILSVSQGGERWDAGICGCNT